MQLTQKETSLLKDMKEQERLCADKYSKHAGEASDAQLKSLFDSISGEERQHFDTLTGIESGTVPQPGNAKTGQSRTFTSVYCDAQTPQKQNDAYLCTDLLSSEKHTSHLYDVCVFEFTDNKVRDTLNHIQKEEQEHGKALYDYMSANCMY